MNYKELKLKSNALKKHALKMIFGANSGHPGGSLSSLDLLTVLFYGAYLKYDPKNPEWEERDYFVLSKGHVSPAYYSILSDIGFFNIDETFSFRQVNSLLQGHPSSKIPGVEISTGSLGQGLSVASGIALGLNMDKKPNKVWVMLGDGELQEGQVWESVMASSHYNLGNLIAVVDKNGLQIDGKTEDVMSVGNVGEKFKAFGWEVFEVDGHDFEKIDEIYKKAIEVKDKPVCIVATTIKGKGVSYMEGNHGWHGKSPNQEEFDLGMKELDS